MISLRGRGMPNYFIDSRPLSRSDPRQAILGDEIKYPVINFGPALNQEILPDGTSRFVSLQNTMISLGELQWDRTLGKKPAKQQISLSMH